MPAPRNVFEPAKYSLGELNFLLDWAGKPPSHLATVFSM